MMATSTTSIVFSTADGISGIVKRYWAKEGLDAKNLSLKTGRLKFFEYVGEVIKDMYGQVSTHSAQPNFS